MKRKNLLTGVFALLIAASFVLAACQPAANADVIDSGTTESRDFVSTTLLTRTVGTDDFLSGVLVVVFAVVISLGIAVTLNRLAKLSVLVSGSLALVSALVIVVIVGINQSYAKVDAGEIGVVVRQGEPIRVAEAGQHWLTPWVDKMVVYNGRDFTFTTLSDPFAQGSEQYRTYKLSMNTSDGVKGDIAFQVQARLDPAKILNFYTRYYTLENGIVQLIKTPALSRVRNALLEKDALTIATNIDSFNEPVGSGLSEIMADGGLIMIDFAFRKPDFGTWEQKRNDTATAIQAALEAKELAEVAKQQQQTEIFQAETNAQVAKTQAQGEADSAIIAAEGEAKVTRTAADAEAYATLKAAEAEAEANRLVAESITAELTDYYRWLNWDGALPTFQITGESPDLLLEVPSATSPQ